MQAVRNFERSKSIRVAVDDELFGEDENLTNDVSERRLASPLANLFARLSLTAGAHLEELGQTLLGNFFK